MVPCSVKSFVGIQEYRSRRYLLLEFRVTLSSRLIKCSMTLTKVELTCIKPSMCLWIIFRIARVRDFRLSVADNRLIGRRFSRNLGPLPGFGKAITFASFQDAGKRETECSD
jgi:hypothetical protein